jgi:hypothetical protein
MAAKSKMAAKVQNDVIIQDGGQNSRWPAGRGNLAQSDVTTCILITSGFKIQDGRPQPTDDVILQNSL